MNTKEAKERLDARRKRISRRARPGRTWEKQLSSVRSLLKGRARGKSSVKGSSLERLAQIKKLRGARAG
jgi:hypothetical protein